MDDDKLYDAVRSACDKFDPMPPGMVDRIATVVGELARHDADLEFELMLVVERFRELVGTRSGAQSYTLRFGAEDVDGMVDRIATVVGELARHDADLEFELMLVVERFRELVGTRSGAQSYTLRFGAEDVELLVRVSTADDEGRARLDGWLVPALSGPVQVREVEGEKRTYDGSADVNGRFEFPDVPPGFYRLWLELPDSHTFGTPAFEI